MWEKHLEKMRAERNNQFAPPQIFTNSNNKTDKKKKSKHKSQTGEGSKKKIEITQSNESQVKKDAYSNIYTQIPPSSFAFLPFVFPTPPPNFAFPPPPPPPSFLHFSHF